MSYNIINVKTREQLDELYDDSALTVRGVNKDMFDDLVRCLIRSGGLIKNDLYLISGATMNREYKLTGNNRYNDCINIICVPLENLSRGKLMECRSEMNARWFDDVVDSHLRRENSV